MKSSSSSIDSEKVCRLYNQEIVRTTFLRPGCNSRVARAPSRLLGRAVDEIHSIVGWITNQSDQYGMSDDPSEFPRLSCDQPSIGSLTGVLYTLPTPVSFSAPIQAWPGWAHLLRWFQMTHV